MRSCDEPTVMGSSWNLYLRLALDVACLAAGSHPDARVGAGIAPAAECAGEQPVGTTINWFAILQDPPVPSATIRYRFEIGLAGQHLTMKKDFNSRTFVKWVPDQEGTYTVKVTAKQLGSTAVWTRSKSYTGRVLACHR